MYLFDLSAEKRNDLLKICFKTNRPVYFTTKLSDMELRAAGLAQRWRNTDILIGRQDE